MAVSVKAYPQHYGNIVLTASNISPGYSTTYTTASPASAWIEPYYTKKPKVEITDKDLVIDGLSLRDFMHSVNERLAIVQTNPALEKEFDELQECGKRYRELERKLLEQKQVWETLKKQDT
jgi:hypothetical protein